MPKNLFIAGLPGSGKTTLIKEIAAERGGVFGGFYTEEISENGKRLGFTLKTFDGKSRVFASKDKAALDAPSAKLKKYKIDVACLENFAVPAAAAAAGSGKILVIDEIGSMEILSDIFRRKICEWLSDANTRVLATVRLKSRQFTDDLKNRGDTRIEILTRVNRASVKQSVIRWLENPGH